MIPIISTDLANISKRTLTINNANYNKSKGRQENIQFFVQVQDARLNYIIIKILLTRNYSKEHHVCPEGDLRGEFVE